MASLIAILDLKGKPLIQRSYRDDVPATYIEKFPAQLFRTRSAHPWCCPNQRHVLLPVLSNMTLSFSPSRNSGMPDR